MDTLSSKITGTDYFSAHASRMKVNNEYLKSIATELTQEGYKVYTPKEGLISFIRVESEDKHLFFGFAEVPYRWYLSCNIDYRGGQRSGRTLKEVFDYDSPFTASDIINNLQPKPPQIVDSISYLKLFTI